MADFSKLRGVLGLFRPKPTQEANVARRAITDLPRQAEEMLPSVVTSPAAEEPPEIIGAIQQAIEDKMNKPTSRRDFMRQGVQAAASTALRRHMPRLIEQELVVPLTNAAEQFITSTAPSALKQATVKQIKRPSPRSIDRRIAEALRQAAQTEEMRFGSGVDIDDAVGLTVQDMVRLSDLPENVVRRYFPDDESVINATQDLIKPSLGDYEHPWIEGRGGRYADTIGDLYTDLTEGLLPEVPVRPISRDSASFLDTPEGRAKREAFNKAADERVARLEAEREAQRKEREGKTYDPRSVKRDLRKQALELLGEDLTELQGDIFNPMNEDLTRAFNHAYGRTYGKDLGTYLDDLLEDFELQKIPPR